MIEDVISNDCNISETFINSANIAQTIQIDRQIDRQRDRQIDRQIDIVYIYIYMQPY